MFNVELRRKRLVSLVVGIICGSSLLVLPVHVADLWGKPVAAHIPDPLPLPCRKQNWTLDECRSYLPVVDRTAQQHEADNSPRNQQGSK